jgi:ATP-binding cassette subfamily F protein 3
MVVVSHDRYFLDKVTGRTLELFHGSADSFSGNFSAYWKQKAERVEVQRKTYERQQEEIAKLKDFVRRNHYGQKHAQAEDRRKKLERIEPVPPPREIAAPPMGFPEARRCGDIVLRAEHLSKRFDQWLFQDLSFEIQRGERWGILGGNGTGKTTLLRCLLGHEPPDEGRTVLGTGVKAGYFDQKLSCLAGEAEAVDAIAPSDREFDQRQRRDLLARFGLTADTALQRVDQLSGGERNRAALALLAASEANFLVLDEPTNHLDLWALDALELSLRKFTGTVLFVTHDRFFINRVADHLVVVEADRFRVIEGNYDMYLHLVKQGLAGQEATRDQANSTIERKTNKTSTPSGNESAARRKRRFPYRKLDDLEAEIFERESHIEQLHERLTSVEVLRDGERVKQIQCEIETHRQALTGLYEHWEEAAELN